MAFFTISEDPSKGEYIPDDSEFTIVSFRPHGGSKHGYSDIVQRGKATGSIGINLDPGMYRINVNNLGSPIEEDRIQWVRTFMVGAQSEGDLKRLRAMKPRWAKGMNTSDGARWSCTFPGGCNHKSTSVMGAVMHEYERHLGMDPLKAGRQEVREAVVKATRA